MNMQDNENIYTEIEDVDGSGIGLQKRTNQKMKPFSKNKKGKYKFVGGDSIKNRKSKKLQVRNANRSKKKGFRQELKHELENIVNSI